MERKGKELSAVLGGKEGRGSGRLSFFFHVVLFSRLQVERIGKEEAGYRRRKGKEEKESDLLSFFLYVRGSVLTASGGK